MYRTDADAIVIGEVFDKKTRETPKDVIDRCRDGLRRSGEGKGQEMKRTKKKRLEAAGWKFGDAKEFLYLTDEEATLIEVKLQLAKALRKERTKRKLTQEELSRKLGSSQSRVAKMETGDPSVSLDLLVRSLLKLGASRKDLARHLAGVPGRRAA